MYTSNPTCSRKRPQPDSLELSNQASSTQNKKQKINHPSDSHPSPGFWDNLSNIWLTRNALRELNRRNNRFPREAESQRRRQPTRPLTRCVLAEWKQKEENWRPTQAVEEVLQRCTSESLKGIKLLAKHGGPDLSDLRGVCISSFMYMELY